MALRSSGFFLLHSKLTRPLIITLRRVRAGYAYRPPALGTHRRRRAACPQGPTYLYVLGTRTGLGCSVRTRTLATQAPPEQRAGWPGESRDGEESTAAALTAEGSEGSEGSEGAEGAEGADAETAAAASADEAAVELFPYLANLAVKARAQIRVRVRLTVGLRLGSGLGLGLRLAYRNACPNPNAMKAGAAGLGLG